MNKTLARLARACLGLSGRRSPAGSAATFYSPSPELLVALYRVFNHQSAADLLEGHAYYEFGLYRGFSLWWAEALSRFHSGGPSMRFYGFDSFKGLPTPQLGIEKILYSKGDYRASRAEVEANLTRHHAALERISLFEGFFSPKHFSRLKRSHLFYPAAIALVDCDLYESCVPVLEFLASYLVKGSILIFDDFNHLPSREDSSGERRALREFQAAHPSFTLEHLFDYALGSVFQVTNL